MREILFRGKRIYNGECVYGYHFYDSFRNKAFITPGTNTFRFDTLDGRKKSNNYLVTCFEVTPESISQSTGLEDTNGTPIFEGDIVVINTSEKRKIKKYRVEFDNGIFGIRLSTNANDNTIIPLRAFDYIEIIKGEEND